MCNNPITLWNDRLPKPVQVPCGYCQGCRLDSLALWTMRANYEYADKEHFSFVTFTYDDYHLPRNKLISPRNMEEMVAQASLDKEYFLHHYLRKLRENVRNMSILPSTCRSDYTTFVCGEYGDQFNRPHYHAIFFGLDFHDMGNLFKNSWKLGNVDVAPLLPGGVRYVMKYLEQKQSPDVLAKWFDSQGLERPFVQASRRFGSKFFYEHRDEIASTGKVKIGSRYVPIPAYFKRLYFDPNRIKEYRSSSDFSQTKLQVQAKAAGFASVDEYCFQLRKSREIALMNTLLSSNEQVHLSSYAKMLYRRYYPSVMETIK